VRAILTAVSPAINSKDSGYFHCWLAGIGRTASADQTEPFTIGLSVRDTARVPDDVLTHAQAEVTRIYLQAGVEIVWRAPSSPSAEKHAGRETSAHYSDPFRRPGQASAPCAHARPTGRRTAQPHHPRPRGVCVNDVLLCEIGFNSTTHGFLGDWSRGSQTALDQLLSLIYAELGRVVARKHGLSCRGEGRLQRTAETFDVPFRAAHHRSDGGKLSSWRDLARVETDARELRASKKVNIFAPLLLEPPLVADG
jgi:hypothetical protein